MSAKNKLLTYFIENVEKSIERNALAKIAGIYEWTRAIRTLRQEGWSIKALPNGYRLESLNKNIIPDKRHKISRKSRYIILFLNDSTCQNCGRKIIDGIKLEVYCRKPLEQGGTNNLSNLWALCEECYKAP